MNLFVNPWGSFRLQIQSDEFYGGLQAVPVGALHAVGGVDPRPDEGGGQVIARPSCYGGVGGIVGVHVYGKIHPVFL